MEFRYLKWSDDGVEIGNSKRSEVENGVKKFLRNEGRVISPRSMSIPRTQVGIPEFLNGIGKGTETHVAKLESEIGDLNKSLVTRTLGLKKLGIPCKHRKLIRKYTHKYKLGLWRPRMDAPKA